MNQLSTQDFLSVLGLQLLQLKMQALIAFVCCLQQCS